MKKEKYYHGTMNDFEKFEDQKKGKISTIFGTEEVKRTGMFFTKDLNFAKEFGCNVYEVELSNKAPLDLTNGFKYEDVELFKDSLSEKWMESLKPLLVWEMFDGDDAKEIINIITEKGYDSIIMMEEADDRVVETTVIFNKDLIKITNKISLNNKKKKKYNI